MDKKSKTFQTILLIILSAGLGLGLMIVGGVINPPSRSSSNQQVQGTGSVVVWGPFPRSAFLEVVNNFNQENQNISLSYVAKNPASYEQDLLEAFAVGRAPDLFVLPHTYINRYKDKVLLIGNEALPSSVFEETYSQGTSIFRTPAGTVGVPIGVDPLIMYYNRDILESDGFINPPQFWNGDFLNMVERLSVRNTDNLGILRSGVAMGSATNINHFMPIISTLIMQLGNPISEFNTETGEPRYVLNAGSSFTSNPTETALSYFMQFSNPSTSVYAWNSAMNESRDVFARGDSAFYFGFASELIEIQRKNPNLNFSVAPIPQTQELSRAVTYGNYYAFAVPRVSNNSGIALNVAGLLANGPYSASVLSSLNLQPVRRQTLAFNSPSFIQKVFFDAAIVSRAWLVPHPNTTNEKFKKVISDISSGVLQTQNAVGALNQILNES